MIEYTDVALSDDDVMFSGARAGSSNQGNSGRSAGRKSGRGRASSPAAKAAATRRRNARAGMSAAEKARDTRAFNSGTGKYAKKKTLKKRGATATKAAKKRPKKR